MFTKKPTSKNQKKDRLEKKPIPRNDIDQTLKWLKKINNEYKKNNKTNNL